MNKTLDMLEVDGDRIDRLMSIVDDLQCALGSKKALIDLANALEDFTSREKAYALVKMFNYMYSMEDRVGLAMELLTREDKVSDAVVRNLLSMLDENPEDV